MQIKWLGHSSFLIISRNNLKIITDPYTSGGSLIYDPINESADIVTVSHSHSDHNNPNIIQGHPVILKEAGSKTVKDIKIKAIPVFHDEFGGTKRGNNLVFCFQIDNLNLCHLGDLGHSFSAQQISAIGIVDILFIPVGGYYTFNPVEATHISDSLNPKIIFPMHYKTPKISYPISGIEEFLNGKLNVRKIDSNQIEISCETLPKTSEIIVLKSAN
jgi:L-ascorbate metabolism protein UlaG (beta-lactamase superfamily)